MTATLPQGDDVTAPESPAVNSSRRASTLLQRQGILVVLIALLFGSAGALYILLRTPEYTASTQVQVDATEVTATVNGDEVDEQEISTQRLVMSSDPVAERVIDELGLDRSVNSLQNDVTVEQINDSRVLRLTVTWDSPSVAAQVANSFAEQYLQFRNEERDSRLSEIGATEGLRAAPGGQILSAASGRQVPTGPSPVLLIGLCVTLGLVVGVMLAYLRESIRARGSDSAA